MIFQPKILKDIGIYQVILFKKGNIGMNMKYRARRKPCHSNNGNQHGSQNSID